MYFIDQCIKSIISTFIELMTFNYYDIYLLLGILIVIHSRIKKFPEFYFIIHTYLFFTF